MFFHLFLNFQFISQAWPVIKDSVSFQILLSKNVLEFPFIMKMLTIIMCRHTIILSG